MNLKQLEAFITVAEQGSFSRAAQRLFTSPTALTQQLNALERYLQCTVLERTYRGVRLTPAGEVFYQYAKSIMKQADEAVIACRTKAGLLSNSITIGTYREQEMNMLLPHLSRFAEICPDIEVKFLSRNYRIFFDLLKSREIDLFVHPRDAYIEKNGFCFQKMGITNVCCSIAKDHPLAAKDTIAIEDLRGQNVIVSCGCQSRSLDNLIDHLRQNEPDVKLTTCRSDEEIWLNVISRNYVMISLDYSYQVPSGCLFKPLAWPEIIQYGIIHRQDDNAAVKRFLNFMKTAFPSDL